MEHTFKGLVISVVDDAQKKVIAVEVTPAVPAESGKPAIAAKRIVLTTNAHELLPDSFQRGAVVSISFDKE